MTDSALPAATHGTGSRQVQSAALGLLEVPADQIITFPGGLPGFAGREQFALVGATRNDVFWLQSCDAPELVFLLADPFPIVPAYSFDIPSADLRALGEPSAADVLLLVMVALPASEEESPTVNLIGPVAINLKAQVGRQLIRGDDHYTTKHPIPLTALLPESLPEV